MLTFAVDCSLVNGMPGIWCYVGEYVTKWGKIDLQCASLIEFVAVIKIIEDFPEQDLCIVCDVDDITKRYKMFGQTRYKAYRSRNPHPTAVAWMTLWNYYDKLAICRNIQIVPPSTKNHGLHGQAHKLARSMRKRLWKKMRETGQPDSTAVSG
jgi:hypothetical protein